MYIYFFSPLASDDATPLSVLRRPAISRILHTVVESGESAQFTQGCVHISTETCSDHGIGVLDFRRSVAHCFIPLRSPSPGETPIDQIARFSVRLKRSDARAAVRNICLNGTSSKQYFQGEDIALFGNRKGSRNFKLQDNVGESNKNQRPKSKEKSKYQRVSDCWKSKRGKNSHRQRGQNFDDDDDGYEHLSTKFSKFGGQRSFTWSFNSDEKLHFDKFYGGFEWRDCSQKAKPRTRIWNESDLEEEEEESIGVSLQSHRRVLGLPLTGPLTLDAIKSAFHAHALKWHPDKHGGPSQAIAEEKFKELFYGGVEWQVVAH